MSDNTEPVMKPEATADAILSEDELEQVVGGEAVHNGVHIQKATITTVRPSTSIK